MAGPPPPWHAPLTPWVERVHLALLLALLAAVFFLPGVSPDADSVFLALIAGLVITLLPLLVWTRPWAPWAVAPYAVYAAWWGIAWMAHPGAGASQELIRQGAFLAIVASVPRTRGAGLLLALTVVGLGLTAELTLGPRSVESFAGRLIHYRSLDQWSGYPEIGLLVCMGGAATLALLASPRWRLRGGAGVLTAIFLGALAQLYSRSAMVTLAIVAGWLLLLGAVRFRSRVAAGLLLACLIGGTVAATRWPDARLSLAAYLRLEGWETDVRAQGWRVAGAMLRDHPWVGVGPTRYPEAYEHYSTGQDRVHAYNLFLHTGAELGIIGLLAALWMWARVLVGTARAAATGMPGLGAFAVQGMLMAFLIRSQSEHFLANLPTSFRMLLLLGFLFGLAEAYSGGGRAAATGARQD